MISHKKCKSTASRPPGRAKEGAVAEEEEKKKKKKKSNRKMETSKGKSWKGRLIRHLTQDQFWGHIFECAAGGIGLALLVLDGFAQTEVNQLRVSLRVDKHIVGFKIPAKAGKDEDSE